MYIESDHFLPCSHATMPHAARPTSQPQTPAAQPSARGQTHQPPQAPAPSAPPARSSKCHQGGGVFLA